MGKNKSSTPAEREIIWNCFHNVGSVAKVVKNLSISRGKVVNAIKYYEQFQTFNNLTRKKQRKTTIAEDRIIARMSKADPFLTSTQIRSCIELEHAVKISARTVRRRLAENNLHGRVARRKPNVSKKNIQQRLRFAKTHLHKDEQFWKLVVWSDESKFNIFGNDGRPYVRRPINAQLDPKYTKKTVKHGGSSIMVWGCFTSSGVGPLVRIHGKMTGEMYKNILQNNLTKDYEDELPLAWIFQHDNDPKHTSRVVKAWFAEEKIRVLDWPAQSPDLNPIENLWGIVKRAVAAKKPSSKNALWHIIQAEWNNISPEQCRNLVNSVPQRCTEVIRQKGYPTKY